MTGAEMIRLVLGTAAGFGGPYLLTRMFRAVTIEVEDEETVLVTSQGKLVATLDRPGLHFYPARALPWVKVHRVSRARDFREIANVHLNDADGTSIIIDLWVEFRIVDPAKALFAVENWERSLSALVHHSVIATLSGRAFKQIVCDRLELGELVRKDIEKDTSRWGIRVELVFVRNVSLLPELARQIFQTVSARLELAKADIEEEGRLRVAHLEAETSVRVAQLLGEAKGQYPKAVGQALVQLKKDPEVFCAYNALYELSQIPARRTHAFIGFGDIGAAEAAMTVAPSDGTPRSHGEAITRVSRDGSSW